MDSTPTCPLAVDLASRLRDAGSEITERWLERIVEIIPDAHDPDFPATQMLDLGPPLIDAIAEYIEHPPDAIMADAWIVDIAAELGELRFGQGFGASDVLREYDILGGVLHDFVARFVTGCECTPDDLLFCSHRVFRALSVIERVTAERYLRVLAERVAERDERLRRVNRTLTHELKNRVGATLGAGQLLQEEWLGTAERQRFALMVADNAQAIQRSLENLTVLSKLESESRRPRDIPLTQVVTEVFRHLREFARARDVDLRVGGALPDVAVNAAAVELSLSNYLSNSIRYSAESAAERWAEVVAAVEAVPGEADQKQLVVRVRDNGIGVPPELRDQLFDRFFRAPVDGAPVEGTGLGLSLVRETMETRGGRAWAEFDEQSGSTFAFSLPFDAGSGPESDSVSDSGGAAMRNRDLPTGGARAKASG